MKTKLVAVSVALLSCLAATSTKAGTDWSFSFGYSSGGVAGAVQVAAPVRAPACVVPAPCAPVRRVAWVAPAPVVVAVPAPRPYMSCVGPVVVRPVPVCAPVMVVHGRGHHYHHGYRHGW